ncbi:response regulator transcription factor [Streptomyces sp. NBC_00859]|uniref:response regulator transcription factor n=1 Tax=Streptomyces sp. NBC_00859 TaxID=2903682 RepID=UPI00386B19AE|nr:response regulator transcription factor [Streptomyces sp. NBC_00859]
MRVLVVEDEAFLAAMIAEGLRREAITADVALDGLTGLHKLQLGDYDVLVLDRDLPGMHGDELCRRVVAEGVLTRILMLTASTAVPDRVEGLGMGADDYLTKPFSHDELLARVLALGRRAQPALPPVIEQAGIVLDTARRQASRHGRTLALTRKEFGVLETLLRADGGVVSGEDLIEKVWDEHTGYDTNPVRVALSRLRAKLGEPPAVETVPGAGYRIPPDRRTTGAPEAEEPGASAVPQRPARPREGGQ